MTLRELRNQITTTETTKNLPSAEALRQSGTKLIAKEKMPDGTEVSIYESGFAIYTERGHEAVIRVDQIHGYTYRLRVGLFSTVWVKR